MDKYNDGWRRYSGNFQYVSASSFKVTGDETAVFPAGTRIRLVQKVSGVDTTKYFTVESSSYSSTPNETTVVVVASGTTLTNADIASPAYNYEYAPQGYPGFSGDTRVAKVALTPGNANAFAFAWQNPLSVKVLVHRVIIDRTAAGGTATSVLDVGVVNGPTDTADTLIDGLDLNATGIADNISDIGTNGKARAKMDEKGGTNDHLTGKILVANAASLAGFAYIHYTPI